MARPVGSGRASIGKNVTNFTLRVPMRDRVKWQRLAQEMNLTTGALVRAAMEDYFDSIS